MSTRKTQPEDNAPLSQERYMSSREYTELRGLSGTAVAARVAIVEDPATRRLLWFLQAKSLEPGGLKQVAREILTEYADRVGTASMHKIGMKAGQVYKAEQVKIVREELGCTTDFPLCGEAHDYSIYSEGGLYDVAARVKLLRAGKGCRVDEWGETESPTARDLERAERDLAESQTHPVSYPVEAFIAACHREPEALAAFLMDVCVNPRVAIRKSGDSDKGQSTYEQRLESEFPQQKLAVQSAERYWFRDIIGALLDYQRRQEDAARADFVLTAIGRKVWETLDFALKARGMVVIQGLEGRGKSEAAAAWCRCHRGEARFVKLNGVATKTMVFRAIAKELGIASSYSRTATEMQSRIEDVLQRSKLAVVVDESHFMFQQGQRIYSRPEILDWIDTALCNAGVPSALISTPQFIRCVKKAELQVGWNWRQFRRRVRRFVMLDQWNTDEDMEAVARKIFPGLSKAGIKLALNYAKMGLQGVPSRDISGLGDVAREAQILASDAGRDTITFDDVSRAVETLKESDESFAVEMLTAEHEITGKRNGKRTSTRLKGHLKPASTDGIDGDGTDEQEAEAATDRTGRLTAPHRSVTPVADRELVAA